MRKLVTHPLHVVDRSKAQSPVILGRHSRFSPSSHRAAPIRPTSIRRNLSPPQARSSNRPSEIGPCWRQTWSINLCNRCLAAGVKLSEYAVHLFFARGFILRLRVCRATRGATKIGHKTILSRRIVNAKNPLGGTALRFGALQAVPT